MAVRFSTSGNQLTRTTNLPTITSFSLLCWAYTTNSSAAFAGALALGSTGANFYAVGIALSSTIKLYVFNGGGNNYGTSTIGVNTWAHVALTVAGTGAGQCLGYVNGVQELSVSGATGPTAATMYVGNTAGSDLFNGRVTAVKVYSAVLTADEIKQEMRSIMPVRTANLNTWSPLLTQTDVANYGGAAGAWTVGGTLTTENGPPVAWSLRPQHRRLQPAVGVTLPRVPVVVSQALNRSVSL